MAYRKIMVTIDCGKKGCGKCAGVRYNQMHGLVCIVFGRELETKGKHSKEKPQRCDACLAAEVKE